MFYEIITWMGVDKYLTTNPLLNRCGFKNKIMEELFKDVPKYEGIYQVSNFGNVKSIRFGKDKLIKKTTNHNGYFCATLFLNKKSKTFKVHQLVAMAFLNHVPCGMDIIVDHINNVKKDNRPENLQLISNQENVDKFRENRISKYKEVTFNKNNKRFTTKVEINGKEIKLGYFHSDDKAYDCYKEIMYALNLSV